VLRSPAADDKRAGILHGNPDSHSQRDVEGEANNRSDRIVWLEPRLVAEVSYSELMEDRLWDPVLRELRVI
jgi:hypothetical protein